MNLARQFRLLARVFPPAAGWHEQAGIPLVVPTGTRSVGHWQPLPLPSRHHPEHLARVVSVLLVVLFVFFQ